MLKLSFISKNTRETDNTLEKSTKILYDAYIGSPGASLSCLRGYKSNMAPGTVKRAIVPFAAKTLKFLSSTLPAHSLDKNKSFLDVVVIVSVVDVIVAVVGLVFVVVLKKCNLLDASQL